MELQLKKKILEGNHHRENFFFFSFLNYLAKYANGMTILMMSQINGL
jgi:hypothetical protein